MFERATPLSLPFAPVVDGRTPTFIETGAAPSSSLVLPPFSVARYGTTYYAQLGTLAAPSWVQTNLIATNAAALTANRVLFSDSNGQITTASTLTYNGTTLGTSSAFVSSGLFAVDIGGGITAAWAGTMASVAVYKKDGQTTLGQPQVFIGSANTLNSYAMIGYGWTNGAQSYAPCVAGYQATSSSGSTKGDFLVATRNATTDTAPTERFRIVADGSCRWNSASALNGESFTFVAPGVTSESIVSGMTVAFQNAGATLLNTRDVTNDVESYFGSNTDGFLFGTKSNHKAYLRTNNVDRWSWSAAGDCTISDGLNIVLNTTTGTKLGTATSQKLGLWNATPVVQPSTTGTATGFTAGGGTAVTDASTFTGGTGSTAYRISDIVLALKQIGAMAA